MFVEKLAANSNANKRQKLAQDFLNSIDQTGELLALMEDDDIDEVKQERMEVQLIFFFLKSTKIYILYAKSSIENLDILTC